MFSQLLAVTSLAVAASAAAYPRQTQDVRAIIQPVIDWNDKLFGITAEDVHDEWHDANGKPSGSLDKFAAFVQEGVAAWKEAGEQLAAVAKSVDTSSANAGYIGLLQAVYPKSFETTWFYRAAAPWSVGLGVSLDAAKAFGAQYDEAWLGAIKAVEAVIPQATRDYKVTYNFFWLPSELENYYYNSVAAHVDAVPWKPIVQYCTDVNKRTCNDGLSTYETNTCVKTEFNGAPAQYRGLPNLREGFPWTCQIYTDSACTDELFVPKQPCPFPPELSAYCQRWNSVDWNGQLSMNPSSTASNPSLLSTVTVGSFKCT